MFIKTTKSKNYTYVQLIQGFREGKKVKHKVLVNLGRLDQLIADKSWNNVIEKLSELLKLNNIVNLDKCDSTQAINWGYLIYKKLWNKFKLNQLLPELQKDGKTTFDLNNSCFLMAIQHLLDPCSKLGTFNKQERYLQHKSIDLNHLYRSLDLLCENKEKIEQHVFKINCDIYKMKIDVVFYDVTTFHFESTKSDDLKKFGFSKNCKFNEVQVVLGMFIDCEGRPIGYELFPGNTFDSKTLKQALNAIENRFGIRNIIIVADRGINSKINLKHITDLGYKYIVAARIKNIGQGITKQIFDKKDYLKLNNSTLYKVLDHVTIGKTEDAKFKINDKVIITYSEKRAIKDKADRQRLIDKAKYFLENKDKIREANKRGGKKYLLEQGKNINWTLNQEAIVRDEQFDGYYGIQTNEDVLDVEKILSAYHTLWKIEESFRIMKSTLEVRPIFHWTESRIKGHFVLCFLAFLLERTMEFELHTADIKASTNDIRDSLNSMNFTELNYKDTKYFLTASLSDFSKQILSAFKIKVPPNSMLQKNFNIEKFISN